MILNKNYEKRDSFKFLKTLFTESVDETDIISNIKNPYCLAKYIKYQNRYGFHY